ncbi:MAG: DUF4345 domain-containing protein [Pseudomonadota bacterium]
MKRAITRLALISAGAVLVLIGAALMVSPKAFLEMSHVFVEQDPGLMSELTAPSGVLILAGALLLIAGLKLQFANLALIVGVIVYASYGLGRLVSMVLNGLPSESLIIATIIELGIATMLGVLRTWTRSDLDSFERHAHTRARHT